MAIRFCYFALIVAGLINTWSIPVRADTKEIQNEIPEPKAVSAYKHYWSSFDAYEKKHFHQRKDQNISAWNQLRQEHQFNDRNQIKAQIEVIKNAIEDYRSHLNEFPNAENRPFVMLNLAQMQNYLADLYAEINPESGDEYKKMALLTLGDLAKDFPDFQHSNASQYLRAVLFKDLNQEESAQRVWKSLCISRRSDLYQAYGCVALGDHAFGKEDAEEALKQYKRAKQIIKQQRLTNDYEMIRVQYRIAWAAYRSANLSECIEAGLYLLQPHAITPSRATQKAMIRDAVELIGDALFENDDPVYTKSILARQILRQQAAAIGLRVMQRYLAGSLFDSATDVGSFVAETYPTAPASPDVLTLLADVYKKEDKENHWLSVLERLAIMLPKDSLWRQRNHQNFEEIENMERKAKASNLLLASHFYEKGMINGSIAHFNTAAAYYQHLLSYEPTGPDAEKWQLKKANCHFFAGELDQADAIYAKLKSTPNLTLSSLEVSSYQQVMTRERRWRQAYANVANSDRAKQNPLVLQRIRELEESIEHFANRFPQLERSVDLLLVGASANRDMERFAQASNFWQRALVSNPSPAQRSIAVRGLVLAKVRSGSPQEVIAATKRYLRLEDWDKLGTTLGNELRGILSSATLEASKNLNNKGKVQEAGVLMLEIAREFPQLPQSDRIYRDGAYLMAIAGLWGEALSAADQYLSQGKKRFTADMLYLKGRSLEFQLQFREAAKTYLKLAQSFPSHSRFKTSVLRAEKLAAGEHDFDTAARSVMTLAKQSRDRQTKHQNFMLASQYASKAGDMKQARDAALLAQKSAKTKDERLLAQLEAAKASFAIGQEESALKQFADLASLSRRWQESIDQATFQEVYGTANSRLADEEFEKFVGFDLLERPGSLESNISQKSKYFQSLVTLYERALASDHPVWTSYSRYQLAYASELFSQQFSEIRYKKNLGQTTQSHLKDQADRFIKLSRRYHSQNLLARSRMPRDFKDNPWVEKSKIKLAGYFNQKDLSENEKIPYSLGRQTPYQWSY